ncbi:hypothetical protein CSB97_3422 [Pseudomonas aeruginosa]|nr:hypothetical protein CSB97_3422 [Pseudomonas aeruginosa]
MKIKLTTCMLFDSIYGVNTFTIRKHNIINNRKPFKQEFI